VDDAFKFVKRETRRNSKYDGIILDPPKFGRGPKGEVWEFYKILPDLLDSCREILSDKPIFVLITAYAIKASSLTLYYGLEEMMRKHKGTTSVGEVVLSEKNGKNAISMAIYGRWTSTS
jgi:23S rRNA (cytosine1962-C5)-methyltransferase